MATGFFDDEGIWHYGEDDPLSPISDYENLGQDSVSAQFTADRLRLAAAEQLLTPTPWTNLPYAGVWTGYTGQAVAGPPAVNWAGCRYRRRSGLVVIAGAVTKPSGSVVAGETIATLPEGFRPTVVTPAQAQPGQVMVLPDGRIVVVSAGGPTFTLSAVLMVS